MRGVFRGGGFRRIGFRSWRHPRAAETHHVVVTGSGVMALLAGDDYYASEGRQQLFLEPVAHGWPSLSGATVKYHARDHTGQSSLVLSAEVLSSTPPQEVQLQVPHAETEPLLDGPYEFDLVAVLSDGDVVSLFRGPLTIAHQTEGRFP